MKRAEIILALAPSFRDRFDFSMPEQYQQWVDMTSLAAEPFVKLFSEEEIAHRAALEKIRSLETLLAAKEGK